MSKCVTSFIHPTGFLLIMGMQTGVFLHPCFEKLFHHEKMLIVEAVTYIHVIIESYCNYGTFVRMDLRQKKNLL